MTLHIFKKVRRFIPVLSHLFTLICFIFSIIIFKILDGKNHLAPLQYYSFPLKTGKLKNSNRILLINLLLKKVALIKRKPIWFNADAVDFIKSSSCSWNWNCLVHETVLHGNIFMHLRINSINEILVFNQRVFNSSINSSTCRQRNILQTGYFNFIVIFFWTISQCFVLFQRNSEYQNSKCLLEIIDCFSITFICRKNDTDLDEKMSLMLIQRWNDCIDLQRLIYAVWAMLCWKQQVTFK